MMEVPNTDEPAPTVLDRTTVAVVPLLAEKLVVHKTMADAGGVRIHKRVHEDTMTVDEPLLRQSVEITRTPIGREIAAPMPVRYEDNATIIPIVEERLVTIRQLFLVEEVRLTRIDQSERAPQIVKLRREEAVVERQDRTTGAWLTEQTPSEPPISAAEASAAVPAVDVGAIDGTNAQHGRPPLS